MGRTGLRCRGLASRGRPGGSKSRIDRIDRTGPAGSTRNLAGEMESSTAASSAAGCRPERSLLRAWPEREGR